MSQIAPCSGGLSVPVLHQRFVPALVDRTARFAQQVLRAHGLHRILGLEFPAQVFTGDELPQPRVERADVVILQIDLDEGLPVVVAGVQLHMVEHHAVEAERGARAHAGQVGFDVAAVVLEQQAVPLAQTVVVQVQAGVV